MLLEKGAPVNVWDSGKCFATPLHYAGAYGHVGTMEVLLEHGADIGAGTLDAEITPLQEACYLADARAVEFLCDSGADVNARSKGGVTALHLAACNSEEGVSSVRVLLRRGADANARNEYGDTPLREAVARGYYGIAKILVVEGGADVGVQDLLGRTAVDDAEKLMNWRMGSMLVRYGTKGWTKRMWGMCRTKRKILVRTVWKRVCPKACTLVAA